MSHVSSQGVDGRMLSVHFLLPLLWVHVGLFSRLNALAKCQDAMPSKHTSTPTTTTFRPRKRNSTTLRVSDHTINAFPLLYSTNSDSDIVSSRNQFSYM